MVLNYQNADCSFRKKSYCEICCVIFATLLFRVGNNSAVHFSEQPWFIYIISKHGIYLHSVIVHQRNTVAPDDPRVHTEYVENIRMRAKRKLRRQFGTSRGHNPSYLHEFMYRNKFRGQDMFQVILQTVAENYAL